MHDFETELDRLLNALTAAQVEFAVCGGVAVAIHGVPRFTKDIDLLVPSSSLDRMIEVAAACGFTLPAAPMTFDSGSSRERKIRRISKIEDGQVLTLDLIGVEPSFSQVWETRQSVQWNSRFLQVVSREGLAIMKRMAGRPQDQWDLVALGLENSDG